MPEQQQLPPQLPAALSAVPLQQQLADAAVAAAAPPALERAVVHHCLH